MLRGLRVIFIPSDFDADKQLDIAWMSNYLESVILRDIVFNVVFGRLAEHEVRTFADHGGLVGLKYAILHEVTEHGLSHMPTFKDRLGYKTDSPIREALTMLAATGLIRRLERTNICIPTVRGRLLLDLTRMLLFEMTHKTELSEETKLVLQSLGFESLSSYPDFSVRDNVRFEHPILDMIQSAIQCKTSFGRDLLSEVDPANPQFYVVYSWSEFNKRAREVYEVMPWVFSDPDALIFIERDK